MRSSRLLCLYAFVKLIGLGSAGTQLHRELAHLRGAWPGWVLGAVLTSTSTTHCCSLARPLKEASWPSSSARLPMRWKLTTAPQAVCCERKLGCPSRSRMSPGAAAGSSSTTLPAGHTAASVSDALNQQLPAEQAAACQFW